MKTSICCLFGYSTTKLFSESCKGNHCFSHRIMKFLENSTKLNVFRKPSRIHKSTELKNWTFKHTSLSQWELGCPSTAALRTTQTRFAEKIMIFWQRFGNSDNFSTVRNYCTLFNNPSEGAWNHHSSLMLFTELWAAAAGH